MGTPGGVPIKLENYHMNKISKVLVGLAMLAASVSAGEEKRGEAGFAFLRVPIGARETSLGTTGLTHASGANALFWNPANAAGLDRPSVSVSYLNHFAGISSNYFAATIPMSDVGTFGFSLNYLSYGDIERTTEASPDGNLGSYSPFEIAVGFSYAKQITDRVSGGLTVKFVSSKIDAVQASGVAFDFGFSYNTGFRGLKLGFVASNIGPQAKYDGDGLFRQVSLPNPNATSAGSQGFLQFESEPFELPASVNFGATMDLYRNEQNSVSGILEQNINSFAVSRTNLGLEYGFKNMFFARGGYTSALKRDRDYRTGKAPMAGLTLGAGVDYKFSDAFGVTIDYGWMDLGELNATHRFTVGVKF
jgi:hypothetical protein